MRRIGALLLLICALVLASCTKDHDLTVSIDHDIDTYSFAMSSIRGITMTPIIEGTTNKELIYHWNTNNDTQSFMYLEDIQTEIINNGEPVLFIGGPEADMNGSNLTSPVRVTLTLKEKDTDKILARDELVLTRENLMYTVKK